VVFFFPFPVLKGGEEGSVLGDKSWFVFMTVVFSPFFLFFILSPFFF